MKKLIVGLIVGFIMATSLNLYAKQKQIEYGIGRFQIATYIVNMEGLPILGYFILDTSTGELNRYNVATADLIAEAHPDYSNNGIAKWMSKFNKK